MDLFVLKTTRQDPETEKEIVLKESGSGYIPQRAYTQLKWKGSGEVMKREWKLRGEGSLRERPVDGFFVISVIRGGVRLTGVVGGSVTAAAMESSALASPLRSWQPWGGIRLTGVVGGGRMSLAFKGKRHAPAQGDGQSMGENP